MAIRAYHAHLAIVRIQKFAAPDNPTQYLFIPAPQLPRVPTHLTSCVIPALLFAVALVAPRLWF